MIVTGIVRDSGCFFCLLVCLFLFMGCVCWSGIGAVHCMMQKNMITGPLFLLDMFELMEYKLINEKRVVKHETMKLFKSSTPNPTLCFIERRTSVPVASCQLSNAPFYSQVS